MLILPATAIPHHPHRSRGHGEARRYHSVSELETREQEIWSKVQHTSLHHPPSRSPIKHRTPDPTELEKDIEPLTEKMFPNQVSFEDIPLAAMISVAEAMSKDPVAENAMRDLEELGRMASSPTEYEIARRLFLAAQRSVDPRKHPAEGDSQILTFL